jgi:cytochrome-b5 reductase
MTHRCRILMTGFVTHDVKRFVLEKPDGYDFEPGMATEFAIDQDDWREEKRPFTFTSLPGDEVLELTLKAYPEHEGVTARLHELRAGDALLLDEPWGTIRFRGAGVFVAGGAGITPFLSILRHRYDQGDIQGNTLLFANRTVADIIQERELRHLLGEKARFVLDEAAPGYPQGQIDVDFLKEHIQDFSQPFYLCGPPPMVEALKEALDGLGARFENLVFEQ